jgi:hypothetical protein
MATVTTGLENRIARLQGKLRQLKKVCNAEGATNSLLFEDVISDLATLFHSLETERIQIQSEQKMCVHS